MSDSGDTASEMNDDPSLPGNSFPDWGSMDDETIDDLFASPSTRGGELGQRLAAVRAELERVEAPAPNAKLAEYVAVGLTPAPDVHSPRTVSVRTKMATLVGTTAGKLLLGATVAVAAVGGAQTSGAVHLPLFDGSASEQVSAAAPDDGPSVGFDGAVAAGGAITNSTGPAAVVAESPADTYAVSYEIPDVGAVSFLITHGETPSVAVGDVSAQVGWSASRATDDAVAVDFSNGTDAVRVSADFADGFFRVHETDSRTEHDTETYYDDQGEPVTPPYADDDDGPGVEVDDPDSGSEVDSDDSDDESHESDLDDSDSSVSDFSPDDEYDDDHDDDREDDHGERDSDDD